jgi:hypothetical protein
MLERILNKVNANRNVTVICLTVIIVLLVATFWRRIGTPEHTENNITNKYDQSHNQWQATMVFPDKTIPFEYTSFIYEDKGLPINTLEEVKEFKLEMDKKCVVWFVSKEISKSISIIGCFVVKKKPQ